MVGTLSARFGVLLYGTVLFATLSFGGCKLSIDVHDPQVMLLSLILSCGPNDLRRAGGWRRVVKMFLGEQFVFLLRRYGDALGRLHVMTSLFLGLRFPQSSIDQQTYCIHGSKYFATLYVSASWRQQLGAVEDLIQSVILGVDVSSGLWGQSGRNCRMRNPATGTRRDAVLRQGTVFG